MKEHTIIVYEPILNDTINEVIKILNTSNKDNILTAQNLTGTLNKLSNDNYIIFKKIIKSYTDKASKKTDIDFDSFETELDKNFYNWQRFFGALSVYDFLETNIFFIILFILLLSVFIYKHKHNIQVTTSYLELFITILVFSLILFIYHRCANYHKGCDILGVSGSSVFAFILCLGLIIHLFKLHKQVTDKQNKQK